MEITRHSVGTRAVSLMLCAAMLFMCVDIAAFADGTDIVPNSYTWKQLKNELGLGYSVMLSEDVTGGSGDTAVVIPAGKDVTLDLNGHNIDRGLGNRTANEGGLPGGGVFIVESGASLTVKDSAGGGTITGGFSEGPGGGLYVAGNLILSGVAVSGCRADFMPDSDLPQGGGIYIAPGGSCVMSGVSVTDNSAMDRGSGVYVSPGASLCFSAGPICISGNFGQNVFLPDGAYFSVEGNMDGSSIGVTTENYLSGGPVVIGFSGNKCHNVFFIDSNEGIVVSRPRGTGYELTAMTEEYASSHHIHDYDSAEWTWADDLRSASVAAVCADCGQTLNETVETVLSDTTATASLPLDDGQTLTATADRPGGILYLYRTGSYMNVKVYADGGKIFMTTTQDGEGVQYDSSYAGDIRAGSLVELRYTIPQDADLTMSSCRLEYRDRTVARKTLTLSEPVSFHMPVTYSNEPVRVYIDFRPVSHSITWEQPDDADFIADGGLPTAAAQGQSISFSIDPDTGYGVYSYSYTCGGDTVTFPVHGYTGEEAEGSFVMPAGDVTVTADIRNIYSINTSFGIICSQSDAFAGDEITGTVETPAGQGLSRLYYCVVDGGETDLRPDEYGSFSFVMPEKSVFLYADYISGWADLQRKINGAADGEAVSFVLDGDVIADTGDAPLSIPAGKVIVLDLNGHTLNRNLSSPAENGGAVKVSGSLTLRGGTVTGGAVSGSGGGVSVTDGGRLTLENVNITGNTASNHGGGVYIGAGAGLNVAGTVVVKNNTGDNLYLSSGTAAAVSDTLDGGSEIHVTTENAPVLGSPVAIASASGDCASCFVSDRPSSDGSVFWNSVSGQVELRQGSVTVWADLQAALSSVTLLPYDPDDRAYDESGSFTVTLNGDLTAGVGDSCLRYFDRYAVIIDLNGHTIDRNLSGAVSGGQAFSVEGGTLVIRDSAGGGAITGGRNTGAGGGVYVQNAAFIMEGGSVAGNRSDTCGGGVYVSGGGSFTMKGGSVDGNTGGLAGGGVYVDGGSFHVSGSPSVTDNLDGESLASNLAFGANGGRVTLDGPLTAGARFGVSADTNVIPLTAGYAEYNGSDDFSLYFTADTGSSTLYLISGGDGAGEIAAEFGHTDSGEPVWRWDDANGASAVMYCVNCGGATWTETADVTGPVFDTAAGTACYIASVTHGEKVYTARRPVDTEYVSRTEPFIDGHGLYVPGCEAHYETSGGDRKTWFTPDGEITDEDACVISYFVFSGNNIEKYTGPFAETGTTDIVLPAYYPEGTALTGLGGGGSFLGQENADRAVTIDMSYMNCPVAVASGAFAGCSDVTVKAGHVTGLVNGEHNDETGVYTVEMTDAHRYDVSVVWADDYTSAVITITCSCGDTHTIEAEDVTVTAAQDPDTHAFALTAEGEYDGESYGASLEDVPAFHVTVNAGEDGAGSAEFYIPAAQGENYAVFTPERTALEGVGLITPPAGARIRDLGADYALGTPAHITGDTTLTARWESTWALVCEALETDGAEITLYNSIAPGEGDAFLRVPAGVTAALDMDGYTANRCLVKARNDGFVLKVEGTLSMQNGFVSGGYSTGKGGGVYVASGGVLNVEDITVCGNSSLYGGGVYVAAGGVIETGSAGCTISGNRALLMGGGMYLSGSAGNASSGNRGPLRASGAGGGAAHGVFQIYGNIANQGGGVSVGQGGQMQIQGSQIIDNEGAQWGHDNGGAAQWEQQQPPADWQQQGGGEPAGWEQQGGGEPAGWEQQGQGGDPAGWEQQGGGDAADWQLDPGGGDGDVDPAQWELDSDAQWHPEGNGGGGNEPAEWGRYDNIDVNPQNGGNQPIEIEPVRFDGDGNPIFDIDLGLPQIDAGGAAGCLGNLPAWGKALIIGGGALLGGGALTGLILYIDRNKDDEEDSQKNDSCSHSWEGNSCEWSDDYKIALEVRKCSKCGILDRQTLNAAVTVDAGRNTVYTVTMTNGAAESRTVKPFKVIVKGGEVSGGKDILIAHGKGEGASYTMESSPGSYDITVPDGYRFGGWDSVSVSFGGSDAEDASETVTALWKVRVRYASGGGSGSDPADEWVDCGGTHTLKGGDTYTREDYEFDGWSLDPGGDRDAGDTVGVDEPTVVTAKWKRTKYTLSFLPNGGGGEMGSVKADLNEKITLPENGFTPPAGQAFDHWSVRVGGSDPADKAAGDEIEMTADAAAEAIWSAVTYAVITDGVTNGTVSAAGAPRKDETITLTVTPGAGYVYKTGSLKASWKNGENTEDLALTPGEGENVFTFVMPAADVTLTAEFLPVYTVSFDLNGGTGAIDDVPVTGGEKYVLPDASSITPPQNTRFKEWSVKIGEADAEAKQPDSEITVTADTVVTAVWTAAPAFKTTSLILSGRIGVNFYMDLDCLTDAEKAGSYMEFTVNGETRTVPFSAGQMNKDKTYYGFTCRINSVQMADDITAVYHYGEGMTVTETHRVETYLDMFSDSDGSAVYDLIRAINDYGYYAQRYLSGSAKKPWTLGVDHKAMKRAYTGSYENRFTAEELSLLAQKAVAADLLESDVGSVTYSLTLDTDTAVNLYVTPADGYTGPVGRAFLSGGTELGVSEETDGRWRITIPGISAHLLGKMYHVTITTENGDSAVDVSALSYVSDRIGSENTDEYNAVCALFDYYLKAAAYRASQN